MRPHINTTADNVLKLMGPVTGVSYEGKDENGLIMAWHYVDCVVVLHWRDGCYRVKEVRANERDD